MNAESRLARALAGASPSARDHAFLLAVLERAEQQRFRRAALRSTLQGAALTGAAAALMLMFAGWAQDHAAAVTDGVVTTAALITLIGGARMVIRRLQQPA